MQNTFKRALAVLLSLSILLSLGLSAVFVSAEGTDTLELLEPVSLSTPLTTSINCRDQVIFNNYGGVNYLYFSAGGMFYAFNVDQHVANPAVYAPVFSDASGISNTRGMAVDSKGNVYIAGDPDAVLKYDQKKRKRLTCAFQKGFARQYPCLAYIKSYPPGYRDDLHNHDYPQMWYCLSGTYIHQVGDQVYACTKGSVIVVPSGVFHAFWIPDDGSADLADLEMMYDIFLDTPIDRYQNAAANLFLPPFAAELGLSFPAYRMLSWESQAAFETYVSWFSSLVFNLHSVTPNAQIYEKLEAMFSLPEFALPEEYREKAAWLIQVRLRPMLRVLAYLNLHYPEKVVEEVLLHVAAVCRTDLYRYFKCLTGYSCFDYLRWLRISHAATYMTNTTYSLSFISDMCGFSNLPHMSRIFRHYTGNTPSKYREGRKAWLTQNPNKKIRHLKYETNR